MEIVTEIGPGSGEGGFRPLLRELHASPKPVSYISQHPVPPLLPHSSPSTVIFCWMSVTVIVTI